MHQYVESLIRNYLESYQEQKEIQTRWGEPLVGYAAAGDERFKGLKKTVSPTHALPQDLLADARTVIAYFLPFARNIPLSNVKGEYSSREWAIAYSETNQLIYDLNQAINKEFRKMGYQSTVLPATHNFDEEKLISDWSHRHVARIAGLGKFGLNNMLITAKGCGGRLGSIVTNLELEPSPEDDKEYCLYKARGTCRKCIQRCVGDALKVDSFDRKKCYEVLLDNDRRNPDLGLVDVCGKCIVNVPCTFINPVKEQKERGE